MAPPYLGSRYGSGREIVVSSPGDETPSTSVETQAGRPLVLVLGGGFGGIAAARKLKEADVDVTLVDRNDFHTFQPLRYRVATDLLETSACGHPLRDLFHEQPHVAVHAATVTGIDLARREVRFAEMAAPLRPERGLRRTCAGSRAHPWMTPSPSCCSWR